jgi:hypothetical protein
MNQRRHAKAFPLAATLVIVALAICFVTFAVKALTVKYQVVQAGSKIKQYEHELNALALSNQSLQTTKDRLTSPTELKKKFDADYFKGRLIEINETFVYTVGRPGNIARTLPTATPVAPVPGASTRPSRSVPAVVSQPAASRSPKATVAAANVLIGREDRR